MTRLKNAFFALIFLTSLHPKCSTRYFFQGSVGKPEKNENLKCLSKQSNGQKHLQIQDQLAGFFALDKRSQKEPVKRIIQVGTNFTYECCGKEGAVFRWGLYEKGVWSPSVFFSRVEINKDGTYCSVFWTPIFKNSTYFGRTFADYNKSSKCVKWILSNVAMEDNNIFVAVVRDNSAQGRGFRECTPVLLNASEAETPFPAATTVRTQNQSETSPTALGPYFTTAKPSRSPPSSNTSLWITLGVTLPILVVAIIIIIIVVKRKWCNGEIAHKIENDEEDGHTGDSKDELL